MFKKVCEPTLAALLKQGYKVLLDVSVSISISLMVILRFSKRCLSALEMSLASFMIPIYRKRKNIATKKFRILDFAIDKGSNIPEYRAHN